MYFNVPESLMSSEAVPGIVRAWFHFQIPDRTCI